ncbi:hypothetical protein NC796_10715 [Aliifodinibius sp. S!AR15-10]|uniref:SPOR domain-containing protein n=1 Tax=Aliifodinibius sp. S!AR15-10 TaxID=2950437 RepID=UPI00285C0B5D|nr:SPOR domain-containing protein [Aliifodinibius sp. S!AR15-10]MDR8391615.1 hypothetical protein [Aliifodinibius sp. S!AR15-10]
MKNNNTVMFRILIFPLFFLLLNSFLPPEVYGQDRIPREYTNPDEVVTFDRSTSFQRALDVINEFAQENLNKVIIDRTNTEGSIGISVPPMHWRDALDLMLRVKNLVLLEQKEFFEIVAYQQNAGEGTNGGGGQAQASQQGQQQGDGEIVATIDSREVRINAIFFEGSRRALREVGVDWSTLTENVPASVGGFVNPQAGGGSGGGGGGGGQGGQNSGQLPATSGFNDKFVSVNSKGAQNVSQNVFNALVNFGQVGNTGIEVQALFSAFEADNLGEILASPTIKVMDGEEGRIQVGQDFSIKQRDFAGNVTDEFFSVGTILTVTPTIIEQNDTTVIHLDIAAERSSAQPDPVSTIINKQQAQTQAILVNEEATAVAGLYRSEVSEVRRGVPILKDLPPWLFGLRYLFGYNSKDYQMRELVILVQAEIEPTIQERYDNVNTNKFDVLNEERKRIRDNIERKEEYSPTRMEEIMESDDESPEEPEQEMPDQNPENETDQPDEEPVSAADSTNKEQAKSEEPDYVDPEVKSDPVPLNLGSEGEDAGQQDSMAAEENQETPTEQEESVTNQDEPNTSQDQADEQVDKQPMPPMPTQNNGSVEDYNYFVIGASFRNNDNAIEYQQKLEQEGFNAMILSEPDSSFQFVAYGGYKTLAEAKSGLSDVREYHNSEAWLLTK